MRLLKMKKIYNDEFYNDLTILTKAKSQWLELNKKLAARQTWLVSGSIRLISLFIFQFVLLTSHLVRWLQLAREPKEPKASGRPITGHKNSRRPKMKLPCCSFFNVINLYMHALEFLYGCVLNFCMAVRLCACVFNFCMAMTVTLVCSRKLAK